MISGVAITSAITAGHHGRIPAVVAIMSWLFYAKPLINVHGQLLFLLWLA